MDSLYLEFPMIRIDLELELSCTLNTLNNSNWLIKFLYLKLSTNY